MRRTVLVYCLGSAVAGGCAAFSAADGDETPPLAPGAPDVAAPRQEEDATTEPREVEASAAPDANEPGPRRSTWSFDTDPDAGFGFSYPNKTGAFEAEREVDAGCPSAPACFRSVVRKGPGQSAGRWGFEPYDGGAKRGRYRIALDFKVDCSLGDPNARAGMVELFCADTPRGAVASVSVGGELDNVDAGPLLVTGRYKAAPNLSVLDVHSKLTSIGHGTWHSLSLEVTFADQGALSFSLDNTVRDELGYTGPIGCPGSSVALQVGLVETFGDAGTGECTVRYDNIVFEYPP